MTQSIVLAALIGWLMGMIPSAILVVCLATKRFARSVSSDIAS